MPSPGISVVGGTQARTAHFHTPVQDMAPGRDAPAATPDEVDLLAVFATLWRGKVHVALACLLALALGYAHAFHLATPEYSATAAITLENRKEQVIDLTSIVPGLGGDEATVNTEVEVLRARSLAERLVARLGLIDDPEFNLALGGGRFDLRALFGRARPSPTREEQRQLTTREAMDAISVRNLRDTYVFHITASSRDPEKSARMANTLAEIYIRDQLEAKSSATRQASDWLGERVAELRLSLEEAEQAVRDFDASAELVSPEALEAQNRQVKELRQRHEESLAAARAAEARVAALEAARRSSDPGRMARAADDPLLLRLAGEGGADGRILARFDVLLDAARQEARQARRQAAALAGSMDELARITRQQADDLVTLRQLEREARASSVIYDYFLGRLKEASVQFGIQRADSRILTRAEPPLFPSAPKKGLMLLLYALLGLVAGGAAVLMREMRQNTFRSASELEGQTGHKVLGELPLMPLREPARLLPYLRDKPASAAAEAVRNLRTTLLLSDADNPPGVIVTTSSVPDEGKTTLSLCLAQNLAAMGRRVLLIEGDIRRRVLSGYVELPHRRGLVSVLSGDAGPGEAICRCPPAAFDILQGEPSRVNAADIFSSERFRGFLAECRRRYDSVIIDTPPVLLVPDARVIGREADAVVYAVRWDRTPRNQVAQGLSMFASIGVPVTGLALTRIDPKGMRRYGHGDYTHAGYYED